MGAASRAKLALIVSVLLPWGCGSRSPEPVSWLKAGEIRTQLIQPQQQQRFRVLLKPGQVLRLTLNQQEQDLALTLQSDAGLSWRIDGFTYATGPERLVVVAEREETYSLTIEMVDGAAGTYTLAVAIDTASDRDRDHAKALAMGLEAIALANPTAGVALLDGAVALAHGSGDAVLSGDWLAQRAWKEEILGRTDASRHSLAEAARLFTAAHMPSRSAVMWMDLALAYAQSDPRLARALFAVALSDAQASGSPSLQARIRLNFGEQLLRWGDFSAAIGNLEAALATLGNTWPSMGAEAKGELAIAYGSCGRVALARELLSEALALSSEQAKEELRTRLRVELAWTFYLEGRYDQAVFSLQEIERGWGSANDQVHAGIQDRLGSALRASGRFSEAMTHYARAEAASAKGTDQWAHVVANLADLALARGNYAEARARAEQARRVFLATNQPLYAANALKLEARALAKSGQRDKALGCVAQAVDLLEALRTQVTTPTQGASLTSAQFDIYQDYLELMLSFDRKAYGVQAFELLEWVRSRAERERYAAAQGENTEQVLPEQALDKIQQEMALIESVARPIGAAEVDRLLERVESSAGRSTRPTSMAAIDLATIQTALLEEDDLLLSYSLGPKRSFLFVVDRRNLDVYDLPAESEIAFQVDNFIARLSRQGKADEAMTRSWGLSVAKLLLGSVGPRLKGKRLLLVKDGILHRLPFAALPDPDLASKLMVENHEIAVLPSATQALLATWARTLSPAGVGALALVDPIYDARDPRLPGSTRAPVGSSIERLPGTAREAAKLAELRSDALVLGGADASKAQLLRLDLGRFEIVHFGVHGQLYDAHPSLSRLLLSGFDANGQSCDGALRAQELALLSMPVELAVLSGCRTAQGRTYRGDGLWSLGRDFMSAGATRVLVSLWDVDDHATAELMISFYEQLLAAKQRPSEALRQAQLALLRRKAIRTPYYWAAFELQGSPKPLRSRNHPIPSSKAMRP